MTGWKDRLLDFGTALVVLAALGLVGFRVSEHYKPDPLKPHHVEGARKYAGQGHILGSVDATVKVVEFADYQCPFCQQVEPVLTALRQRYPNDVSIVFRHFPLIIHDSAVAAARAAECAAMIGMFDEFHHILFKNAKVIGVKSWQWFAAAAGIVDTARFDECVETHTTFPAIERDQQAGVELGITATPTFLIDEMQVSGVLDLSTFEKYVEAAKKRIIEERR